MTTLSRSVAQADKPYVKNQIGTIRYHDPYSEKAIETETISVYVPQMATPPTSVEPQEKLINEYTIYVVPPGDYLYKISKDVYGDEKFAMTLALFNGLENPDFLPVNYPLKLPPIEQIESLYELVGKP